MEITRIPRAEATGEGRGKGSRDRVSRLSWTRTDSYWEVVCAHLPLAIVTGIALMLPHAVSCDDLPLIPCTFLTLTGYPCPFCGLTRSFWAIAHGDWAFALHNAPISCLIYVATALLFSWHLTALITGLRIRSSLFCLLTSPLFVWLMVSLAISNWAYRLFWGFE
ncbi:MAG: DUF2752 domain-containing protein [Deltaproteobacteria bacterium]|nr:DUF2752 domain-containing protein [Deltaproteobacteria bacterium]